MPAMADAVAPAIVAAQAIGRLGNYFNQELYGGPTSLPWGLEIRDRVNPATGMPDPLNGIAQGPPVEIVHPTFLYEMIWNLGVAALVVWADRRFRLGHGRAFAVYVAGYTAGRFWIELMRTDDATHVLGLRVNVWTAILVFAGAVVYIVLAAKRGPREDPESLQGRTEPPPPPAEAEAEENKEPVSAGDHSASGDQGQVQGGQ